MIHKVHLQLIHLELTACRRRLDLFLGDEAGVSIWRNGEFRIGTTTNETKVTCTRCKENIR